MTTQTSKSTTELFVADVRDAVNAELRAGTRAAKYVNENNVTVENMSEHVATLTALAYPNVKPDSRATVGTPAYKAHNARNKFRQSLQRALGVEPASTEATKYATALALKDADRESAILKFAAEWDAAHKTA